MKRDRVIFAIDVGGNENATLQLSIRRKKKIEKEREEEYIILELPRRKFVNSFRFPYSPLPLLLSLSLKINECRACMIDGRRMYRGKIKVYQRYGSRKRNSREDRGRERTNLSRRRIDRGGGRESGVSFCRRFIRKWRCETRIKCYSSSVSRWIRGSSPTGARDKSMLPQSPGRVSLLVDRSPFTERGWGTTEISSNGSNGMLFEGILWGGGGEEGKKCRETAASP